MVESVLATDMAVHFDLLKRFTAEVDAKPDLSEWTDRTLLFQMLLHLADIANPSRPFHLARGWAERVIEEFCDQVRPRNAPHYALRCTPRQASKRRPALQSLGPCQFNLIRCPENAQGDREAASGLSVSPMCNRANMNMPKAQLGFINIFLKVGLLP